MLCMLTSVHDPAALAATCQRLGLRPPEEGCQRLGNKETPGWVVHLPGLHGPLVFDTLSGVIAYHPRDNAFALFARIVRFVYRYYDVRARLRRSEPKADRRQEAGTQERRQPAQEVA